MKTIFWKLQTLFHYLLSRFICVDQYCKRCGRFYPKEVWTTENRLWDKVIPGQSSILEPNEHCMRCFTDIAESKGIHIVWEAHEYLDYTDPDMKSLEKIKELNRKCDEAIIESNK